MCVTIERVGMDSVIYDNVLWYKYFDDIGIYVIQTKEDRHEFPIKIVAGIHTDTPNGKLEFPEVEKLKKVE